jgi:hypothetical protein
LVALDGTVTAVGGWPTEDGDDLGTVHRWPYP